MQRTILILFLVSSFSLLLGCGEDTGGRVAVSGTVTFKGEPLESGTIQFDAADGSLMSGATITAGKYEVPAAQGLLPGKYTVRVSSVSEAGGAEEAPGDSMAAEAKNKDLIPAEFNTDSTTTMDVTAGSPNTFDLDIP